MGRDLDRDPLLRRRKPSIERPASNIKKPRPFRLLIQLIKLITEIRMKKSSWKTTLGGVLVAAGQFLPGILPPEWDWIGSTLTGVGGLILGSSALDAAAAK